MRCECCNKILSYKESTSRFVTEEGEPRRYTNMCTECVGFVGVPVITRSDLPEEEGFELEGNEYGYEEDEEE